MTYKECRDEVDTICVSKALMVRASSFPPFVIELRTRDYPNTLIAASQNADAIRAAARLWLSEYAWRGSDE